MRRFATTAVTVSGLAILAGCSGAQPPGYTTVTGKFFESFSAASTMDQANAMSPSGDAYSTALYNELMGYANFEFDKMEDYRDAVRHANKAMTAAQGGAVEPTNLSDWQLPADSVDELSTARSRLVAALATDTARGNPEAAAAALASFDCWVEQQEENFQPRDIAACRDKFYASLDQIEPKASAVPEVMSLQADVFFDFGSDVIKESFFPILDDLAASFVENTDVRILVWGHTDTAGPAEYNQGLSERRAAAVAEYLQAQGVTADRMETQGFGETQLAVQTPDNTPEPQNRRVEIRRR